MDIDTDLHEEALEIIRRWWQAWIDHDVDAIQKMVDTEYTELGDNGRLKTLAAATLAEEVRRCVSGRSITEWELTDPDTKVFEDNIVCSYAFRITGRQGRHGFVYEGRATDILTRKDGRWIFVLHDGLLERCARVG